MPSRIKCREELDQGAVQMQAVHSGVSGANPVLWAEPLRTTEGTLLKGGAKQRLMQYLTPQIAGCDKGATVHDGIPDHGLLACQGTLCPRCKETACPSTQAPYHPQATCSIVASLANAARKALFPHWLHLTADSWLPTPCVL